MDLKTVKQLAELMQSYGLTELEYAQDNGRIHLVGPSQNGAVPVHQAAAPIAVPVEQAVQAPAVAVETIDSPLVGTFYRSASPDAAPFVSEGTVVTEGTVVCVVEAMKVMNEIKAEKSGVISKILVKNGAPVEFGQPMFELTAK